MKKKIFIVLLLAIVALFVTWYCHEEYRKYWDFLPQSQDLVVEE